MTPEEKLNEIETREYLDMAHFYQCRGQDRTWLINRVKRLTEALEFYADQDNWVPTKSEETNLWAYTTIYKDSASSDCLTGGEKARKALEEA